MREPGTEMSQVRDALRKVRVRASLTDAERARRAGLNCASYANIENGHKCPSLGTAFRIARVLNEPVEQLFADDVAGEEPVRERARVSIPISAEDYDFVRGDVVIGTARFVR